MNKGIILTILLLFAMAQVWADELALGYQSFAENDVKQATQHFTAASQDQATKAEAFLMLSLISASEREDETSFKQFLEFYNSSSNPDPYLMALFNHSIFSASKSIRSAEQLKWLLQLSQRSDINSTLKANIMERIGKHYEATLNFKKANEYYGQIGAVMNWQIVGDFENISASGFDKNFDPITHPEPEAVFKNKINAEVKWFNLHKYIPGKWINFRNNFVCNNTLVFAQTFCNSPADQLVELRIGTSGSLKVWINDQLIFEESEERNNGIDTYLIPAKIFQGNNRILLQLGCSKIEQCNFMMRVTDREGHLLSQLPFTSTYSPYKATTQDQETLQSSLAESFLAAQVEEHPETLVNYLVLANAYLANDKTHEAMAVLEKAQTMAPNCTYILYQLLELYTRDQDRTMASVTQEKLKAVAPENSTVLNILINEAFDAENLDDARKYIEKKEQLYGENKDLLYFKLRLAGSDNKIEAYSALLNRMLVKYPSDYDIVSTKYKFEKEYKKNQKGAIKLLKDFTKKYYDESALLSLSDELIETGKMKEGFAIIQQLMELDPSSDNNYRLLGLYYLQAGYASLAKPYLEECLAIAPYYGTYHGNLANALLELGDTVSAVKEYQLDIHYSPDDYDVIKKIRDLNSKKAVFDDFGTKDYYALYTNAPSAADYPSDNIVSLTEERQIVLYEEGGYEMRHIIMIKALTLKGIDLLKEYRIGYLSNETYTIEKAEVLKKNGNRLQAEVNNNQIVYTSLEPGDAVYLIYKKSRSITGQMSKNFYEKALLNTWYPCLNIEYNLLVSKNLKFDYKMDHTNIEPEITDKDEFKLYSWRKQLNKSILFESYMPSMIDYAEMVHVSTLPNWDYVSKWYYDISNTKTKPEAEVIDQVNELLAGKEQLTEMQKARIFYNFIEENIRYSSVSFRQNGVVPQEAAKVLVTRIGDCKDLAVLFTSMCRVAKIKSEIVLVLRRQNGNNWMALPSFDFDHAMAKANLDGKDYYIELTSSYFPFAALSETHINAVVLDVNNDKTQITEPKLLNPETRQPNNMIRESKVSFEGDNMITTVASHRTGALAVDVRAIYREVGKEERETKFIKSITEDYSNVKLLTLDFDSTLNNCSDTLLYSFSYMAPKVFAKINNLSIVKLPLTDKLTPMSFLSLEDRKFTVELWQYSISDTLSEHLIIAFPENKSLAEVPQSVHYSCNQADYSLNFHVEGNTLVVDRKLIGKMNQVPVADYAAYRDFIEQVVSADGQQIGFK